MAQNFRTSIMHEVTSDVKGEAHHRCENRIVSGFRRTHLHLDDACGICYAAAYGATLERF